MFEATRAACALDAAPRPIDPCSLRLLLQHEVKKSLQVSDGPHRPQAEFLERLIEPVDPDGGIPERRRPGCIPPAEGGKDDIALFELETIHTQLIGARIRLVGVIRVRADESIEQGSQSGIVRVRSEHGRTEIRYRDHADAGGAQPSQCICGIGPWREPQVRIHELLPLRRSQFNVHRVRGVQESIVGDSEEIDVAIGDRSQPAVLELSCPPQVGEFLSLAWSNPIDRRTARNRD